MDKKVNKVMDKKEAGNIFISYTDKNKDKHKEVEKLFLCKN